MRQELKISEFPCYSDLWTAQRWKTSYDSLSNGCPNGPSVTSIPKNSRKFSSASWGGDCFDVFSFSLLKIRWSVDEISNPLLLWTGVSSPTDDETGMTGPGGTTRTRGSELGESSGMILADNGPDLLGDACGKDILVMGDRGYTTNSKPSSDLSQRIQLCKSVFKIFSLTILT